MNDSDARAYFDMIKCYMREKGINPQEIYYEAWIDFDEQNLDRWENYLRNHLNLALYNAVRCILAYERFYDTPKYVQMLDQMAKTHGIETEQRPVTKDVISYSDL